MDKQNRKAIFSHLKKNVDRNLRQFYSEGVNAYHKMYTYSKFSREELYFVFAFKCAGIQPYNRH